MLDGLGSVGDGLLGFWGIGGGPGVCAAAPIGRVVGREFYRGGVVVDGVLVIAAVEMSGAARGVGAGRVGVQVDDFAVSGDCGEPLGGLHVLEAVPIEAFGVWVGDVGRRVVGDYDDLCPVGSGKMVWRWRSQGAGIVVRAGGGCDGEGDRADDDGGDVCHWTFEKIGASGPWRNPNQCGGVGSPMLATAAMFGSACRLAPG